jgi:hypothetical protein
MYVKLSWSPMAALITKYHNKYVCRGLCLIYMFSFYFWSPSLARKMRKSKMRYYPEYQSRSSGNSYQAEALTTVLRYHTCRLSLPEDRKLPITELKWDARTVTDIPCNNPYWFFAFFWLTKGNFRPLPVSRIA